MKHGKKLSRSQKEFLASLGLNPDNYLVERKLQNKIGFINKETNKVINHKTRVELTYIFKTIIETMEEKHESEIKRYRDSEIELLLATKKRCKKARVKTKYKNKILKIAEKRLAEIER